MIFVAASPPQKSSLTSLQKGLFTAEYAEQYYENLCVLCDEFLQWTQK